VEDKVKLLTYPTISKFLCSKNNGTAVLPRDATERITQSISANGSVLLGITEHE